MKKLLKIFSVLACLALSAGMAACGGDKDNTAGAELSYSLNHTEDGYVVTGCSGEATEIIIPSVYNELPVTEIGDRAFYNYDKLRYIEIPDSVTTIGDFAFSGCWSLGGKSEEGEKESTYVSVTIPNSVTEIGESAFAGCGRLTSLTIPDSVTTIGKDAFSFCWRLEQVTIGESVTTIGKSAFENCIALADMTVPYIGATKDGAENTHFGYIFGADNYQNNGDCVPSSLKKVTVKSTSIDAKAFSGCKSLMNVVVDKSVTTIGKSAFEGCNALADITLPFVGATKGGATNTHFGYIFGGDSYQNNGDCVPTSLKKVTVTEDNVIEQNAFRGCNYLTKVSLPDSVTTISNGTFAECSRLTEFVIPASVSSIGENAFDGCSNLPQIVIADTVTEIGSDAFAACDKLTVYCKAESQPLTWAADWISNMDSVYWYSAKAPALNEEGTAYLGNFWSYDEKEKIVIWVYVPETNE